LVGTGSKEVCYTAAPRNLGGSLGVKGITTYPLGQRVRTGVWGLYQNDNRKTLGRKGGTTI